jgi:integrase
MATTRAGRPKGSFASVPSYRLHKASGQAIVTIGGKDHYLGQHGTAESKGKYERLIGEWIAAGRPITGPNKPGDDFTITELCAAFWVHVTKEYDRQGEHTKWKAVLGYLRELYPDLPVKDFGPLALQSLRAGLCERKVMGKFRKHRIVNWSRSHVNKTIGKVKLIFRWAAANELVTGSQYHSIHSLPDLRAGKSKARETERIKPADRHDIDAAMEFLPPLFQEMVRMQLLTGMRSGELFDLRTIDLDTTKPVWVYAPLHHKTAHRGRTRQIFIGPEAQEIIRPRLKNDLQAFIFSPSDLYEWRDAQLSPTYKRHRQRVRISTIKRGRKPRRRLARFTTHYYRFRIIAACDKAEAKARKDAGEEMPKVGKYFSQITERWIDNTKRRVKRFHPHQLRHTFATEVAAKFGPEIARVLLGHNDRRTTDIYAEPNTAAAVDAIAKAG